MKLIEVGEVSEQETNCQSKINIAVVHLLLNNLMELYLNFPALDYNFAFF